MNKMRRQREMKIDYNGERIGIFRRWKFSFQNTPTSTFQRVPRPSRPDDEVSVSIV